MRETVLAGKRLPVLLVLALLVFPSIGAGSSVLFTEPIAINLPPELSSYATPLAIIVASMIAAIIDQL